MMPWIDLGRSFGFALVFASSGALAAGCSGSGAAGGPLSDAGSSGGFSGSGSSGGLNGLGGTAGEATGGAGAGGTAGAGTGGASGASGGGTGGAPPMCSTSVECGQVEVSFPGNTAAPTPTPTECAGGQCGLVTYYSGSYDSPKPPRSCSEICAASTYDGQPMECSASCSMQTINGFGDQGLVFGDGMDAGGPGSVAGLVRFQFSPISGAYKFDEVSCSEVPPTKLIQGSNSYKYVSHRCCCVAP